MTEVLFEDMIQVFHKQHENWCLIDDEGTVQEYDEMIHLDIQIMTKEEIKKCIEKKKSNPKYILLGEGYGMNYTVDGELRVWRDKGVFYKYAF